MPNVDADPCERTRAGQIVEDCLTLTVAQRTVNSSSGNVKVGGEEYEMVVARRYHHH